ncbi:hypothetical protein ACM9HF_06505 [Colwellia sp. RE-S-Sl-9]
MNLMIKYCKTITITCSLLLVTSCGTIGNKIVYEMAQPPAIATCDLQPPTEKDLCYKNSKNRIPYEQYKKERKAIIEGNIIAQK